MDKPTIRTHADYRKWLALLVPTDAIIIASDDPDNGFAAERGVIVKCSTNFIHVRGDSTNANMIINPATGEGKYREYIKIHPASETGILDRANFQAPRHALANKIKTTRWHNLSLGQLEAIEKILAEKPKLNF